MSQKIENRDPADLRLHALQKQYIPEPDKQSPEWLSFVDGLSAAGPDGIPPLAVTADGRIMDGARRWLAARQIGWPTVPCITQPEEHAAALIVESLLGQRNMARCAKVYVALTLLDEFIDCAEQRRLNHIKNGVKTLEKPLNRLSSSNLTKVPWRPKEEGSVRSLAEKFGVSHETIRRAQDVVRLFAARPDLKAKWEPLLLSGDKNLWNVLSAAGGAGADQSHRTAGICTTQLEMAFARIGEHAATWEDMDEPQRETVLTHWRKAASLIPKPLRKTLVEILENAR
jgi:hypothetical protein